MKKSSPPPWRGRAPYSVAIPAREAILAAVNNGPAVTLERLARTLDVAHEGREALGRRVDAMLRDGELILKAGGRLAPGAPRALEVGRVSLARDGYGFVAPAAGGEDLFIPARALDGVMHGDTIAFVRRQSDADGRVEARVVEVRERALKRVVGRLARDGKAWRVLPIDRRGMAPLALEPGSRGREGDIVTADIVRYPSADEEPLGRIAEVLGAETDPGIEIEIALRRHDLPQRFSAAALAAALALPETLRARDKTGRRDLTDLPLVTIDGEDARDFDDAVYCEPVGRTRAWRLVVAIADVSHYVTPGSALDADARERGTSVYFPRRVLPMLPEKLSNGLCSLNPDVDRLVMACDMRVSAAGLVEHYEFYPAVMHSKARLTYTEVAACLADAKGEAARARRSLMPSLTRLHKVYQALLAARTKRGAVDFESGETRIHFDAAGRIARIVPIQRNDAHRLIEECMLAANVCAAHFLERHKHPALFRVHAGPTAAKLENLRAFLGPLSLSLGGGESPTAQDYARLAQAVRGRPDAQLISSVMLRSMQQAQYSPDNIGHFGLAYEQYAHFTSPIRRYPDLIVHRAIKALLKRRTYAEPDWDALGAAVSQSERRADEASREVVSWLKCQYAARHLGEPFEGTVSGVTAFGLFVTLDDLLIDGLLHVTALPRDYYVYDAARHALAGERSGRRYRLGDRISVRIVRSDPDSFKIDLEAAAAESGQNPHHAKPGGKRP
ncbi:MAG: ribonuclease R [Burkholderiales bacterium]|nr:ribonuclease R [Burkholderiales bacterium]